MTSFSASMSAPPAHEEDGRMYVTMRIDTQLFGIPVVHVRDVLRQQKVTVIPLAPKEVAGSLNLRGRIVTVVDVRQRLDLPARAADAKSMFVVVEHKNELYSLVVDSVGEVLNASAAMIDKAPPNLEGAWKDVSAGIYQLDGELLIIVDVPMLLTL